MKNSMKMDINNSMTKQYLPAQDAVKHFMTLAGQTINDKPTTPSDDDVYLRCRLILEEVTEFLEANLLKTPEANSMFQNLAFAYNDLKDLQDNKVKIQEPDLIEAIDAITDIEVINLGTAVTYGVDADRAFGIVHDSNMSKVFPDGTMHKNEFGKVIKPDTYRAPDLTVMLND